MFLDKGYSKEQADLFLKKVNFMENREYFFHKRKYMARQAGANEEDDDSDGVTAEEAQAKLENLAERPRPAG